jgi:hypothetical protein
MLNACCVVSDNHKKEICNFNERLKLACALKIQPQKHLQFGIINEKYPWIDPEIIRFSLLNTSLAQKPFFYQNRGKK